MLSGPTLRSSLAAAMIFACRIFGMIAVLPVLSLYVDHYQFATPARIGLALGAYGLTQALLQMPLGLWSDSLGRKKVISFGLLMLLVGSLMCANAQSIWLIIAGRALQGAGAIGSTLLALLADVVETKQLSKAMMIVGMTIGVSVGAALVLGPWINHHCQIEAIFNLTAMLAVLALGLLWTVLPTPAKTQAQTQYLPSRERLRSVCKLPELTRLNISISCAHGIFTMLFTALPGVLHATISRPAWHIYLPVLAVATLIGFPVVMVAERRALLKQMLMLQITVLIISLVALYSGRASLWGIGLSLAGFFTAFTVLEALLPSLVSRFSPPYCRGTAMGFFSSSQYLGIFWGGALGGWCQTHWGALSAWWVATAIGVVWLLVVSPLRSPVNEKVGV